MTLVPQLTKFLFVLYGILFQILLVTMLIAMMSNTYQKIFVTSSTAWKLQVKQSDIN